MRMRNPIRRTSFLAVMGVFLLAAAVFGWGLQYKISLYSAPGSPLASTPHAKLLSQKERPAVLQADDLGRPAPLQAQASALLSSLLFCALVMGLASGLRFTTRTVIAQAYWRRRPIAAANFFFFRPPPLVLPA